MEKIWKNNPTIVLNILYIEKKCHVLISKINRNCEKKVLWKIPNVEKEKLFALLRWITSKHDGDFYCLNYLHSLRTEKKVKSHQKVCKNKYFCGIVLPSQKDNILTF